jgi:hypothetical protein
MKYTIHLRNKLTGETRVYKDEYDWQDSGEYEAEELMLFMYEEGNYSCDCNRSLFLYDWNEDKKLECGGDIIVIDKIEETESGKIVFDGEEE